MEKENSRTLMNEQVKMVHIEVGGTLPAGNEVRDPIIGVVSTGCAKLNIRKEPKSNAEVVCEIPNMTTVMIEESDSTDEFYKIHTDSVAEGFCMKKYISIKS